MNLEEVLDEIGIVFHYSRAEVMALPLPSILRLYARAMTHLKLTYAAIRIAS